MTHASELCAFTSAPDRGCSLNVYLDSIQSQLYYSTLLRSECFGLFTNHVLLETKKETTRK